MLSNKYEFPVLISLSLRIFFLYDASGLDVTLATDCICMLYLLVVLYTSLWELLSKRGIPYDICYIVSFSKYGTGA